jgi:hypothetical protein
MNDERITMDFTAQELDIIYASLRAGPYQQVAPVIASIERQVREHNKGKQHDLSLVEDEQVEER